MATSQRLVDLEIKVPTSYGWQESYQAALLETDWTKMQDRVQTAESEIHKRRLVLSQDYGGTPEEREALVNAMSGLRVLRMDAASWLGRKAVSGAPKPNSDSESQSALPGGEELTRLLS